MCAFYLAFCFSAVIPGLSVLCSLNHAGFPPAFFLFFCVSCLIRNCGVPCFVFLFGCLRICRFFPSPLSASSSFPSVSLILLVLFSVLWVLTPVHTCTAEKQVQVVVECSSFLHLQCSTVCTSLGFFLTGLYFYRLLLLLLQRRLSTQYNIVGGDARLRMVLVCWSDFYLLFQLSEGSLNSASEMSETGQGLSIRAQKVRGIFNEFDSNRDGCLNRDEMAALVIAVNPRVKFSKDQIEAILDEVFRTYGEFIEGQKGLSFEGLLRTYDDGAGDVDRDFDALGLHLASASIAGDGNDELQSAETKTNSRVDLGGSGSRLPTPSIADETSGKVVKRSSNVGAWARSPNHGITYDETWGLIEDLELNLKRYEAKQRKQRDEKTGGGGLNGVDTAAAAADWEDGVDKGEGFDRRRREDELGSESAAFKKSLAEFREKAGKVQTPDQAFDRHMAMGRCLLEHHWYEEAIKSFDLAERLKPQDVRAPFLMGNAYYSLGKYVDAEKKYRVALEAGEANSVQWKDLLPQVSPVEFFVFLSFSLRTLMNRWSFSIC